MDLKRLERLLGLVARRATYAKVELEKGEIEIVQDELSGLKDLIEEAETEAYPIETKPSGKVS